MITQLPEPIVNYRFPHYHPLPIRGSSCGCGCWWRFSQGRSVLLPCVAIRCATAGLDVGLFEQAQRVVGRRFRLGLACWLAWLLRSREAPGAARRLTEGGGGGPAARTAAKDARVAQAGHAERQAVPAAWSHAQRRLSCLQVSQQVSSGRGAEAP